MSRPVRLLLGPEASEAQLESLTASGEVGRFGYVHFATHEVDPD